jgi:hypothetical protein
MYLKEAFIVPLPGGKLHSNLSDQIHRFGLYFVLVAKYITIMNMIIFNW